MGSERVAGQRIALPDPPNLTFPACGFQPRAFSIQFLPDPVPAMPYGPRGQGQHPGSGFRPRRYLGTQRRWNILRSPLAVKLATSEIGWPPSIRTAVYSPSTAGRISNLQLRL
jgi:hypothetical protein